MGGKSSPAPPDYAAAAEQTGEDARQLVEQQTYANRVDQFSPWGQTTYEPYRELITPGKDATAQIGTAAIAATPGTNYGGFGNAWRNTPGTAAVAASDDYQAAFAGTDAEYGPERWRQTTILAPDAQRALDAELALMGDRSELAGGMVGRLQEDFKDPMDFSGLPAYGDVAQAGDVQAGNLQTGEQVRGQQLQAGEQIQGQQLTPEELQRGVDFSGAEQRTGAEQARQNAEDAIYGRSASRLDPQWEQRTAQKEAQLAARGLRPGDKAYDQAMENMGRERTDAYQQATYGSIMGGGQEASRTVDMQRAGREQDMMEALRTGDFANTAAGQAFQQEQAAGGQNFGQAMASDAQRFGQQAVAGGQNFAQDMASEEQRFGQAAAAGSQNFAQSLAAGGQNFAQQTSQSQQQSQLRQAQLTEMMQQRGMSLNEINAIMSGQQVQMPSMPGYNTASRAAPVDYMAAAGATYGADMDAFNAQQAQRNSTMQGIGSIGSMMMMSDRRLKRHIKRIGTFKRYPWYLFQYIWGQWAVGVMADEVNQDAVVVLPNGFAAVDYARIN